jgi:hypothetical protein
LPVGLLLVFHQQSRQQVWVVVGKQFDWSPDH